MSYRYINGTIHQIGNFNTSNNFKKNNVSNKEKSSESFESILKEKFQDKTTYTISKHANERLQNVNLTNEDKMKIEEGFSIASNKGSKNSVFIYKELAFVASVENKTIITAIEKERAKENCFTNIDSVVIL